LRRTSDCAISQSVAVKASSGQGWLQKMLSIGSRFLCEELEDLIIAHIANLLLRKIGFEASSARL